MLIEPIVLSYLQAQDIPAFCEIPPGPPEEFVVMRKYDSGKSNHIEAVTLEFQSYAPSKYEAALLDEKVRTAMDNIIQLNTFSASKYGGGNDAPDNSTKAYRYKSYYNLFY